MKMSRFVFAMALAVGFLSARISLAECESAVWDLTAGQSVVVGTVTVDNDEENLYITYSIDVPNAVLGTLHLWVGADIGAVPKNKSGVIVPGHFPYTADATGQTTYTFEVNWADWAEGGQEIAVVTHAEISYLDEVGAVVGGDTAFGGDQRGLGKRWWFYGLYTICDEEIPPQEIEEVWENETAWADGARYVERGNWATYTPYVADSAVVLLAGQTMDAGIVNFSSPDQDGMVLILITLNEGWRFILPPEDPEASYEPVKVQDYADAPSGTPSPGLFDHKDAQPIPPSSMVIEVPENNYYGVHVDVEHLVVSEE